MLPPVIGRLVGDNSEYIRSLNEAENATDGSTKRSAGHFSKLGGAIGTAMKVGAAAGGVAVAGFFAKAVSGASDLAETMSKVGVVFGDQAGQVTSFANQMAKDFGLPKGAILDAASSIGLIGKASGLSQGDAAKMSTQLGKLAADASSFYNVPLPEALQAIQSGLVGEAEPMRRFGVLLNEQSVSAEAARLGLEKVGKEYTEGAKAQARASLIMSGMKDASGDLERTQGSLSNRMRELKGRAENFATSVGEKVVPMVLRLMDAGEAFAKSDSFKDAIARIQELVGKVVAFVKQNWPEIQKTITEVMRSVRAIIESIIDIITTIWRNFGEQIMDFVRGSFRAIMDIVRGAMQVVQGIIETVSAIIKGDWSAAWDGIKSILSGAWSIIQGIVDGAMNMVKNAISVGMEIVGSVFGRAWDAIFEFARNGVARIVDVFLGMVGIIVNAAEAAFGWMPGIGEQVREAARKFEEFRDRTNAALRGTDSYKRIDIDTYNNTYVRSFVQSGPSEPWYGSMHGGGIVPGRGDKNRTLLGGEGVFTRGQMQALGMSLGSMDSGGGKGGGDTYYNLSVYTATGDLPDETIRKIRSQLFELENDLPSASIVPG